MTALDMKPSSTPHATCCGMWLVLAALASRFLLGSAVQEFRVYDHASSVNSLWLGNATIQEVVRDAERRDKGEFVLLDSDGAVLDTTDFATASLVQACSDSRGLCLLRHGAKKLPSTAGRDRYKLPQAAFDPDDLPYWADPSVESQLRAVLQTRRDSIDQGFREGFSAGSRGEKIDDSLQRRIEGLLDPESPTHVAKPTGVGLDFRPLHSILWRTSNDRPPSARLRSLKRLQRQLEQLFLQGYTKDDAPLNAALARHDHLIWHQHAEAVQTSVQHDEGALLQHLFEHGYVKLPQILPESTTISIHKTMRALLDQEVAAAVASRGKGEPQPSVTKLQVPNICALPSCSGVCHPIANATVGSLVRGYLGPDATLGFVEAFRLRAGPETEDYPSGIWHHDRVGRRLKLFVLLNQVDPNEGRPTEIIPGSHQSLYYSHTVFTARLKEAHATRQGKVVKLAGYRGDAYLFDTNALHRGTFGVGLRDRDAIIYEFSSWEKYKALKAIDQGCAKKMGPRKGQRFPVHITHGPTSRSFISAGTAPAAGGRQRICLRW